MLGFTATLLFVILFANVVSGFRFPAKPGSSSALLRKGTGVQSLTAVMDVFAGLSLAAQLNNAPINPSHLSNSYMNSLPVAATVTKQGMYKEYTVEEVDTSAMDQIKRGYKTAEETDDSKDKYWTILAVLVFGSFVIPMAQYYWYVAEED